VDTNVSEKHTVCIFRAVVAVLGSVEFIYGQRKGRLEEGGTVRVDFDWPFPPSLPLVLTMEAGSKHL
jgi:hypothetical protein